MTTAIDRAADPDARLLECLAELVAECGRSEAYEARYLLGLESVSGYPDATTVVLPRLRAALNR